ncbi:MAG: restriction endonuclease [Burkholderiaceae bacterium]|nr:restriction endonuclease [Burkholderiaceae bacterium]
MTPEKIRHGAGARRTEQVPRRMRRQPVGWDAAWAARFRRWGAALSRLAIRCFSRALNALRLARRPGHRRNVRHSRRVLRAVRGLREPGAGGRGLAYLRAVDPLVFEEVVMSALEDVGLLVLRSRRYTGDGGIDGEVWLPGEGWFAVQVKRYRSHVDPAYVRAFGCVVRERGFDGGLFIHTGRSGAALYGELTAHGVRLVSGGRLTQLLMGRRLNEWKDSGARLERTSRIHAPSD